MGEGILDNRDTEHRYWLLLEPQNLSNNFEENIVSSPSQLAHHMTRRLNHSPIQFICSATTAKDIFRPQIRALEVPLPGECIIVQSVKSRHQYFRFFEKSCQDFKAGTGLK